MSEHISGAAQGGPTSDPSRFELDFAGLGHSIDESVIAAAGSVFWLVMLSAEKGFPPFDAPLEDAIKRFGSPPQAALDLWRQCAALDRLARRWIGRGLEIPAFADVAAQVRRAREQDSPAQPGSRSGAASAAMVSDEPRSGGGAVASAGRLADAPVEDTVGPDEAVGRAPESGNGAADQLSLGGR